MCEFVFLNHVNICGRILQLTPKNGTNLAIFELTKKLIDLTNFPSHTHSKNSGIGFGLRLARLRVAPRHLARLLFAK
jgi:hypothetical protein